MLKSNTLLIALSLFAFTGLTACANIEPGDAMAGPAGPGSGKADASADTVQEALDACEETFFMASADAEDDEATLGAIADAQACRRATIDDSLPTVEFFLALNDSRLAGHAAEVMEALRATLVTGCKAALDASGASAGSPRTVVEAECVAENELRLAGLLQSSLLSGEGKYDYAAYFPECDAAYTAAIAAAGSQEDFLTAVEDEAECMGLELERTMASVHEAASANFPGQEDEIGAELELLYFDFLNTSVAFCELAGAATDGDEGFYNDVTSMTCISRALYSFDMLLLPRAVG